MSETQNNNIYLEIIISHSNMKYISEYLSNF